MYSQEITNRKQFIMLYSNFPLRSTAYESGQKRENHIKLNKIDESHFRLAQA